MQLCAGMNPILYSLNRAAIRARRFSVRILKEFGITPARFNALRLLHENGGHMLQCDMTYHFDVTRQTVHRMTKQLEALGLIVKERVLYDSPLLQCFLRLTDEG